MEKTNLYEAGFLIWSPSCIHRRRDADKLRKTEEEKRKKEEEKRRKLEEIGKMKKGEEGRKRKRSSEEKKTRKGEGKKKKRKRDAWKKDRDRKRRKTGGTDWMMLVQQFYTFFLPYVITFVCPSFSLTFFYLLMFFLSLHQYFCFFCVSSHAKFLSDYL